MGNAHMSGAPAPPPMAPPPPPDTAGESAPKPKETGFITAESLIYPGVVEDLHKKTKDVFPANFDGVKVMINKGLSNHFQVSHTIALGGAAQSGYRFGATYVGTQQTGPSEAFPILIGDIDPVGNMNANIIHQVSERIRVKLACHFAHIQNKAVTSSQVSTDYRGDKYSASLTVANPNVLNGSGVLVAHYLRSITSRVAVGAELAIQGGPQIPGGQVALLSVAGRYTGDRHILSGTLGQHLVNVCYYQKASEELQIGCELETNLNMGESVAKIGFQIDLPQVDLVFRGMCDSNWDVAGVLEKKLQPLPFTMSLSGIMNHSKQSFRLGFGLIIG